MARLLGPAVLVLAVLGLLTGAASGLPLAGGSAQAGADADLRCDEDGVSVSYGLVPADPAKIQFATVSGIDSDCFGAVLIVRFLFDSGPDQRLVVPIGATSYSFGFSPARTVASLQSVSVTILGHDQEPPNKND